MRTLRIDEIKPIPVVDGGLDSRPIRRTLDIQAFAIPTSTRSATTRGFSGNAVSLAA